MRKWRQKATWQEFGCRDHTGGGRGQAVPARGAPAAIASTDGAGSDGQGAEAGGGRGEMREAGVANPASATDGMAAPNTYTNQPGVSAAASASAAAASASASPDPPSPSLPLQRPSEHVLVSFSDGNSFDDGSVVIVTPEEPPEEAPDEGFRAKVVNYNAERKILKLEFKGDGDPLTLMNHVLKRGTRIESEDKQSCATIEETNAEWHRHQTWARTCPQHPIGQKVLWEVEEPGDEARKFEHEGTVWGWLPADESDYFPDKLGEEGGVSGPLWRIEFGDGIEGKTDLNEKDMEKALKMYKKRSAQVSSPVSVYISVSWSCLGTPFFWPLSSMVGGRRHAAYTSSIHEWLMTLCNLGRCTWERDRMSSLGREKLQVPAFDLRSKHW